MTRYFAKPNGERAVHVGDGGDMYLDQGYTEYPDADSFPPLPEPVPQVITMRQARLALLSAGLLSQVDAAIAAIPDPAQQQAAQIEWEYSATVERNATWVVALAQQLGLDDAALDQLFTEASKL